MEKISIIVLTYNVGNYLRSCLDSIIEQTYQNLEILLVDDGSTDDSIAICEEYRQKDDRIRVIQEKNSGAGPVRNLGVSVATGDYVMFIDGDDTLDSHIIMTLYQQLQHDNADIACCLFYRIDDDGLFYFYSDPHNPEHSALEGCCSSTEWLKNETRPVIGQIFYQAWGKLFKKSLFKNIEYPDHSYGDDALTGWKLYLTANKITYTNEPGYCWRMRSNSITTSKKPNIRVLRNNALAIQNKVQFYSLLGIDPQFLRKRWLKYLQKQVDGAKMTGHLKDQQDGLYKITVLNKYKH